MPCPKCKRKGLGYAPHPHAFGYKDYDRLRCRYCKRFTVTTMKNTYTFLCEDGSKRGAMKGCIQLFPRHPFAAKVQGVLKKQLDYAKKQWKLATWDEAVIDATTALENHQIDVAEWERRVRTAFAQRDAYLQRRFHR